MDDEDEMREMNLSSRPKREERRRQRERDRLEREREYEREWVLLPPTLPPTHTTTTTPAVPGEWRCPAGVSPSPSGLAEGQT